jgi:hypothetical protein
MKAGDIKRYFRTATMIIPTMNYLYITAIEGLDATKSGGAGGAIRVDAICASICVVSRVLYIVLLRIVLRFRFHVSRLVVTIPFRNLCKFLKRIYSQSRISRLRHTVVSGSS